METDNIQQHNTSSLKERVAEPTSNPQLGLSICPQCGQRSLFWNRHDHIYRCVNPECKKSFTLEEYQKRDMTILPDELQAEQGPESAFTIEVIDNQEPAATVEFPAGESTIEVIKEAQHVDTEQMPLNELMTDDNVELGAVEQVLCNEPVTGAKDEKVPGEVEQVPCNEPVIEAKDEIEYGPVEEIISSVSGVGVNGELERGKIDETPSNVPITAVRFKVEAGTKAKKRISRPLAFLIIGVLGIGIIMAGVFLWQKSGDLDKLSSQLTASKEALTASQEQLATSQQDITTLSLQLDQARQEIESLQAQINELRPLAPGEPIVYSGELAGDQSVSIPIELKQFERVAGSISGGLGGLEVYIQDTAGGIAEDLGRFFRTNFIYTAPKSGTYTMIITGSAGVTTSYTVNFTIYTMQ